MTWQWRRNHLPHIYRKKKRCCPFPVLQLVLKVTRVWGKLLWPWSSMPCVSFIVSPSMNIDTTCIAKQLNFNLDANQVEIEIVTLQNELHLKAYHAASNSWCLADAKSTVARAHQRWMSLACLVQPICVSLHFLIWTSSDTPDCYYTGKQQTMPVFSLKQKRTPDVVSGNMVVLSKVNKKWCLIQGCKPSVNILVESEDHFVVVWFSMMCTLHFSTLLSDTAAYGQYYSNQKMHWECELWNSQCC